MLCILKPNYENVAPEGPCTQNNTFCITCLVFRQKLGRRGCCRSLISKLSLKSKQLPCECFNKTTVKISYLKRLRLVSVWEQDVLNPISFERCPALSAWPILTHSGSRDAMEKGWANLWDCLFNLEMRMHTQTQILIGWKCYNPMFDHK